MQRLTRNTGQAAAAVVPPREWVWRRLWGITAVALLALGVVEVRGQNGEDRPPAGVGLVELNFPENVSLKVLTDYVSQRHGINFIYDAQINGRQITLKAPNAVPADSLMTLLESALKINGMVLVPTELEGTWRITTATQLLQLADGPFLPGEEPLEAGVAAAVMRIFDLQHIEAAKVQEIVGPFLTPGTSTVVPLAASNQVIVTDYASNMARVENLLVLVDSPGREVATRFVNLKHVEAASLIQQVNALLASQAEIQGVPGVARQVSLVADPRTNQVIVIARPEALAQALGMIESLDVSLGLTTRIYRLGVASPQDVDELVREMLGENQARRLYQSLVKDDAGLLAATTTAAIHEQVAALVAELDQPLAEAQSPVRFYKLKNAKAEDVIKTLSDISGEEGLGSVLIDGIGVGRDGLTSGGVGGGASGGISGGIVGRGFSGASRSDDAAFEASVISESISGGGGASGGGELPDARIFDDQATNSVIVIAPPSVQPVYEKLIQRLDVRRPQVLVEVTIVTVDTSDQFELGVEIFREGSADSGQLLTFSAFGLTGDAVTPVLPTSVTSAAAAALSPGVGFNGVLLGADIADAVIQALQTDSRARVVTRPQILINDNATGTLLSEAEEPFSTVNTNATVALTSFGGFAEAGTEILITPSISEGDFLQLEYSIELSTFTDAGTDVLPPARQTNILESEASVPDGHTIVVGGLTANSRSEVVNRVPLLGEIPVLEYLFSSRSVSNDQDTLYVFIKPVILRDDQFEDLKLVSGRVAGQADLAADLPSSEPLTIP